MTKFEPVIINLKFSILDSYPNPVIRKIELSIPCFSFIIGKTFVNKILRKLNTESEVCFKPVQDTDMVYYDGENFLIQESNGNKKLIEDKTFILSLREHK